METEEESKKTNLTSKFLDLNQFTWLEKIAEEFVSSSYDNDSLSELLKDFLSFVKKTGVC